MGRRALILGVSGQLGRAMADTLAAAGWSVLAAHRGGHAIAETDAIRSICLDREDDDALQSALGAGVDALIDLIAFEPRHARQLLNVQGDVGAFVVISSASVYCDAEGRTLDEARRTGFPDFGGPIPETNPTVAPGPQTYSTRKAAIEQTLLGEARIPMTILRCGAVYGAGSAHAREWWFIKRLLDRRTQIPLAYDGESRFHTAAAANIAALCRASLENPGVRFLNAADPTTPTVREIGEAVADAMGAKVKFVGIPGAPSGTVGATPWSIPKPLILDMSAAGAVKHRPAGEYRELVSDACGAIAAAGDGDWRTAFPALAAYPYDLFDYVAEDRVLPAQKLKSAD